MSDGAEHVARSRDSAFERWLAQLPDGLRPREREQRGTGQMRSIETIVLLLAGLLLTIATVNDVVLDTHVNHRLNADLRTWRAYTGHDFKNVATEQDVLHYTTTDVVCGNTTGGPPKQRTQICLQMTGPVVHGYRAARGGWYLPPKTEDLHRYRYGCFGPPKAEGKCP
ncbi:MAG TPA: hypothetical protein VGX69_03340 [Solirubrobacteraceae bacterium]|jgi:hypothetical protein|nr:hypothetical protein [Solirubrobacteraceae bacterium]